MAEFLFHPEVAYGNPSCYRVCFVEDKELETRYVR